MAEPEEWNDARREAFRERLRRTIRGELRLNRHAREEIIETCVAESIEEEAPAAEAGELLEFAEGYLWEAAKELDEEMESWPKTTDCDRLDRAEAILQHKGILFWQTSPCCTNCTLEELGDRIAEVGEDDDGFKERVRGYSFYIEQGLEDALADGPRVDLYINYGWLSPGDVLVPQEEHEQVSVGVGREVFEALKDSGLQPEWDGDIDNTIALSVEWKRR